jgi:hypothetical protein
MNHHKRDRGVTIILVIAFMAVFMVILGTITSYTFTQSRYGRALYAREQAVQIAEAGLEYYRWFLAHNPNDLTNGTGAPGPYEYTVTDPEGGEIGTASITVAGNQSCGVTQSIDITSVGVADADPAFTRTLFARHMRPSVAEYSHIVSDNVWAGADRNITGPYHSNGGIRMDGTNNSDVTSAVSTWVCNSSFGCNPTNNSAPGVFGAGTGSALWRFPVPQIDFPSFFTSLGTTTSALRLLALNDGMLLSPTSTWVGGVRQGAEYNSVGGSSQRGYRLVFRSDGTIDIYRVTDTDSVRSYNSLLGWHDDYSIVDDETFVGNFTPPSDCSLIFVQAKAWIEGTVSGKITVVAADEGSFVPNVLFGNNNLTYQVVDGTTGLTVISEGSIIIPLLSPDVMTIRGIFVAQTGLVGRNHYTNSGSNAVPSQYNSYVLRSQLTTNGSVISFRRVGTKWLCGSPGVYCSGYNTRLDNYDRLLAFFPPPFTPAASADYKFVLWRED